MPGGDLEGAPVNPVTERCRRGTGGDPDSSKKEPREAEGTSEFTTAVGGQRVRREGRTQR